MMNACPTPPIAALAGRAMSRGWWARMVDWFVEARSHRVLCFLAGIWMLNGFDLVFTLMSHEQGVLHEQNPLARHLLETSPASVFFYKLGLVLIGSYPLIKYRAARVTEMGALVILFVYTTLAVRWSVCYDYYLVISFPNSYNMATAGFPATVIP